MNKSLDKKNIKAISIEINGGKESLEQVQETNKGMEQTISLNDKIKQQKLKEIELEEKSLKIEAQKRAEQEKAQQIKKHDLEYNKKLKKAGEDLVKVFTKKVAKVYLKKSYKGLEQ